MGNLLYKKGEAIQEVKFKLSLYADIMINGFLSINDRVPSFTTSVLAMPQGVEWNRTGRKSNTSNYERS